MKAEECPKVNECYKVKMILEKVMKDFQYVQCIREVCARYSGPAANLVRENDDNR